MCVHVCESVCVRACVCVSMCERVCVCVCVCGLDYTCFLLRPLLSVHQLSPSELLPQAFVIYR